MRKRAFVPSFDESMLCHCCFSSMKGNIFRYDAELSMNLKSIGPEHMEKNAALD